MGSRSHHHHLVEALAPLLPRDDAEKTCHRRRGHDYKVFPSRSDYRFRTRRGRSSPTPTKARLGRVYSDGGAPFGRAHGFGNLFRRLPYTHTSTTTVRVCSGWLLQSFFPVKPTNLQLITTTGIVSEQQGMITGIVSKQSAFFASVPKNLPRTLHQNYRRTTGDGPIDPTHMQTYVSLSLALSRCVSLSLRLSMNEINGEKHEPTETRGPLPLTTIFLPYLSIKAARKTANFLQPLTTPYLLSCYHLVLYARKLFHFKVRNMVSMHTSTAKKTPNYNYLLLGHAPLSTTSLYDAGCR